MIKIQFFVCAQFRSPEAMCVVSGFQSVATIFNTCEFFANLDAAQYVTMFNHSLTVLYEQECCARLAE